MSEENKINENSLNDNNQNKETVKPTNEEKTKTEINNNDNVVVDDSKFSEKATIQVIRILKDLETLTFHGSKSDLSDFDIESIVAELREQSNVAKKQFYLNIDKTDFNNLNQHVNKISKEIKVLGELANKHSGEYDDSHVLEIFEALKKKINETKKKLKVQDKKEEEFSFKSK